MTLGVHSSSYKRESGAAGMDQHQVQAQDPLQPRLSLHLQLRVLLLLLSTTFFCMYSIVWSYMVFSITLNRFSLIKDRKEIKFTIPVSSIAAA